LCGQRLSAGGDLKERQRHAAGRLLVTRQHCGGVPMSILKQSHHSTVCDIKYYLFILSYVTMGIWGSVVVKAMRY
jgi:hypothetical protein